MVSFHKTPPVTDTETVEMPVPLFPTCIDACGCMVAVGTREGPVILFDVGTASGYERATAAGNQRGPRGRGTAPSVAGCTAGGRTSTANNSNSNNFISNNIFYSNTSGGNNNSNSNSNGNSGQSSNSSTSCNGGGRGRGRGGGTTTTAVSVYGSLADRLGPISAVLLDRAKVVAAGRGSRRTGGGYVIRCVIMLVCCRIRGKEGEMGTRREVGWAGGRAGSREERRGGWR